MKVQGGDNLSSMATSFYASFSMEAASLVAMGSLWTGRSKAEVQWPEGQRSGGDER